MAESLLYTNYHTHTYRCGHAGRFSDEEYVRAAVGHGMKILGFSDHTPWPYRSGFENTGIRMKMDELPDYISSIRALAEKYASGELPASDGIPAPENVSPSEKNAVSGAIRIFCGLECEFFTEYTDYLKELHEKMDYLILGVHWTGSNEYPGHPYTGHISESRYFGEYLENLTAGMESGLFRYAAHPDIIFSDYPVFDSECVRLSEEIAKAAVRNNIPLEFNISGRKKARDNRFKGMGFPCEPFWEIAAQEGCTVIVGCDAHSPEQLCIKEDQLYGAAFLEKTGIEPIVTLPGLE